MKHQPIIIVHDSGRDWHPAFHELAKAGCALHAAPGYRFYGKGDDYMCRNTPGTLMHAGQLLAGEDALLVLCDSDMIFVDEAHFPKVLSGEFSPFMNYDRAFVGEALDRLNIERQSLDREKDSLCCCVPHVIPVGLSQELGKTWLRAIDAFVQRRWEDVMYAFGLAAVELGLKVQLTHLVNHNFWPDRKVNAPIIHYAYGDELWSKRNYFRDDQMHELWNPKASAPEGTILGEILAQITEAREFFRDNYSSFA